LRIGVVAIEEKCYDLLEDLGADVYRAMYTIRRFRPVHFTDGNIPRQRFSAILKFNFEAVATQYYGHPMKRVVMPRGGFSGLKGLTAHEDVLAMMKDLLVGRGHDFPPTNEYCSALPAWFDR
jgi:hypothetical protein